MILQELELKNYKQHKKRKIKFTGNLIGIIGPNGSGKSNMLGSLHYALGGEQPGFKKEDLLHWGADDGFAKLTLQQHGNTCVIRRGVGSSSASMKVSESEDYTGITKVNQAIEMHLGLDKDLLRQAIFARQAAIDAVLFTDPRDRELAFQRLCGMGDANKIHKGMGTVISEIDAIPDFTDEITAAKLRYKKISERLKQLEASATSAQTARNQVPGTPDLQAQLQAYAAILPVVQRIAVNIASNATYSKQVNDAQTQLALLPTGAIELEALTEIAQLRTSLAAAQEHDRLETAWKAAGSALMGLGDEPPDVDPPHTPEQLQALAEAYQAAQTASAAAQAELALYVDLKRRVAGLEAGAECPVCGGEVKDPTHVEKCVKSAQEKAGGIDVSSPQAASQMAHSAVQTHEQSIADAKTRWAAQYKTLLTAYTDADTRLKEAVEPSVTAVELQQLLVDAEARYTAAVSDVTEVARLQAQVESAKQNLGQLNDELADLGKRASDLPDVAEKLAESQVVAEEYVKDQQTLRTQSLAQAQTLDQQLAQLQGMVSELRIAAEQLDKTISELEFKQAQQGALRTAFTVLSNVRDWFHYNNGPKTLSNSILQDMTASVNDFLGQLGAPFTVTGNEDSLGFNCVFHDGRPMPTDGKMDAHHLSGGQRMQLAIAFRLASYCMFTGRLGLLSLDEPTTYLDEQNVGHFCSLLPKLKEVAKSMDLQILIATHAKDVLPHMDTLVNLYPSED